MKGKQFLVVIVLMLALLVWLERSGQVGGVLGSANTEVGRAYAEGLSDVWVAGEGRVIRTLADDDEGSRHQRFILAVDEGHTVLVAHNIDLAPRIDGLRRGDRVRFVGEYVWNEQGGIIHWTHHDPRGRREGGWLHHAGQRYE